MHTFTDPEADRGWLTAAEELPTTKVRVRGFRYLERLKRDGLCIRDLGGEKIRDQIQIATVISTLEARMPTSLLESLKLRGAAWENVARSEESRITAEILEELTEGDEWTTAAVELWTAKDWEIVPIIVTAKVSVS